MWLFSRYKWRRKEAKWLNKDVNVDARLLGCSTPCGAIFVILPRLQVAPHGGVSKANYK